MGPGNNALAFTRTGNTVDTCVIGGTTTCDLGASCTAVTASAGNDSTAVATTAFVLANSGSPAARIFNSADSSSANYSGHYTGNITADAATCVQILLSETTVIAFHDNESSFANYTPFFKLPQLSTVTVGTMYSFTNATRNRAMAIRAYGANTTAREADIYKGINESSQIVETNPAGGIRLEYSIKRKCEITCITGTAGTKMWFAVKYRTE